MTTATRFETFGSVLGIAALIGSLWAFAPATGADAVEPPGEEGAAISAVDFEDGTTGAWTPSGGDGDTLSVIQFDGGSVLRVADRDQDYVGIQSPTGILQPGAAYDLSMRVRLADGVAGTAGVRFVVKPGYDWVGDTTMSADAWTTVSGRYTVPVGADAATVQAYIGTGGEPGVYDYLVDDVSIRAVVPSEPDPDVVPGGAVDPVTTPVVRAQGSGDVAALTFDDGPNGAETVALLDFLRDSDIRAVFCVIGQNIQAPGGAELLRRMVAEGHVLCNHSTSYDDMGALTEDQARDRMAQNLTIIRDALGDPDAAVPFFRAPNGTWGATPQAAVSLGMQPLGVVNTIADWEVDDEAQLTTNLRAAMKPGEIVLVHDGGGDRTASVNAVRTVVTERLAEGWSFTLPVGTPHAAGAVAIDTDFEDGLDGWGPRDSGSGAPQVTLTDEAHGGVQAALVSERTSQGSGIARDVTGVLQPGTTYRASAWLRFAAGEPVDDVWLTIARTVDGATAYQTLGQFTGMSNTEWVRVEQVFTMGEADSAVLYFETDYNGTNTSDLLIDDILVDQPAPSQVQDLTPIRDTLDVPVGVAIDSREMTGGARELLTRHFDQVTSENYMKPEAWYDAAGVFTPHPEADALMSFAQEEDLGVYGHTLVWHSQTPAWFFQDGAGQPLTDSPADQAVLEQRMRDHIFSVAEYVSSTYGEFGSDTNPLYAFDVVNEVVSDASDTDDGLRRSEWYRILGERFIDLAFQFADEAFNDEFAADGADRPVTLFINDYNTEQSGKQQRLRALVERMLDRGVPVDGVGHQFHVSLSTPVGALDTALAAFGDLDLVQAVTELDVTTGTPVTQANLIEQGYYYRDAFRIFRDYVDSLFSVTVWGLTDGRSWRVGSGAPLVFDDALQAKPAYYGIVDDELPARQRAADVFAGDPSIGSGAQDAVDWRFLPLHPIEDVGAFQLRWAPDHLTAYVEVTDATASTGDAIEFDYQGRTATIDRAGGGGLAGTVAERDGGWVAVVRLPLDPGVAVGQQVPFDVRVVIDGGTAGWNTPGESGTLTLVEPLSTVDVPRAAAEPVIDGGVDPMWAGAAVVRTDTEVEGAGGASADVHVLWVDDVLYVLAEVADAQVDVSGSDPWIQDSVEFFVDAGNVKNGPYRYDDTQIRISAANVVSFGTGDEAFQRARVQSATSTVDGGYVVEAAISLLDAGGAGTFHGFDAQVNDAALGARTSIRTWADPTGLGYQSTARWGVARLVEAIDAPGGGAGPGAGSGGDGSGTGTGGAGRGDGLASTGADAGALALAAAALLLAGLGVRAARRRVVRD
ncbi:endo-1,4-beta-xylanase [Diaminobutyricimonas aerilata]|uniref:Beta-xylanase n=1 Tax=Diaminobutyricimonas aerilata TaxID=1162967 RepID=A0A2M9CGU0_9MICO|nr:endo-1,4-beta-xylanase [Diaminobutyricimonas aerilata]PJJ71080.1 endo-1,4-beta-xylanase [Diaminobutyricimonas aerilata]